MHTDIQQIQSRVEEESSFVERIIEQMKKVIVGQNYLVEKLLIGILADGHILIEGVPGLAKTLSVSTLAKTIQA
ncbi:MAG: AAA family ATPase, partial [Candidatus Zixiibacteriota bacterium]